MIDIALKLIQLLLQLLLTNVFLMFKLLTALEKAMWLKLKRGERPCKNSKAT